MRASVRTNASTTTTVAKPLEVMSSSRTNASTTSPSKYTNPYPSQGMNSCIFCLEDGELVHNVKCRCNFCFHLACYEKYNNKTLCPICQKTVGELYIPAESAPIQPVTVHILPEEVRPRSRLIPIIACLACVLILCLIIVLLLK